MTIEVGIEWPRLSDSSDMLVFPRTKSIDIGDSDRPGW